MGNFLLPQPIAPAIPDSSTLLAGLDTEIHNLNAQITSLATRRDILSQARTQIHVFSIYSGASSPNSHAASSEIPLAASGLSTGPFHSPNPPLPSGQLFNTTLPLKRSSSLRRQLLIHQTEGRDESPSLPSADFEAAIEDTGVRLSVEEQDIKREDANIILPNSPTPPESLSPVLSSSEEKEHTERKETWKQARKRKWTDNAAKAREAKRTRSGGFGKDCV